VKCTFTSRFIHNQSIVLVTASEGDEGNLNVSPQRFVGAANFRVENISPFGFTDPHGGESGGGGVTFVVTVDWGEPLSLWTDLVILDEVPQGFIR
jgi:hypothetical protein